MTHVLSVELAHHVCFFLDTSSLCALSQVDRYWNAACSEYVFQKSLESTCPWFEPETSNRPTWKACAFEYRRRLLPDAKFSPTPDFVSPELFGDCPPLFQPDGVERQALDSGLFIADGIHVEVNMLQEVFFLALRSPYGESEQIPLSAELLLVRDVLFLVISIRGTFKVFVKFRNSPGNAPDVEWEPDELDIIGVPYFCVSGSHLFAVVACLFDYTPYWSVYYFDQTRFVRLHNDIGMCPQISCYDGLVRFFTSPNEHCAFQFNLDGTRFVRHDITVLPNSMRTSCRFFNNGPGDNAMVSFYGRDDEIVNYIMSISRCYYTLAKEQDGVFSIDKDGSERARLSRPDGE